MPGGFRVASVQIVTKLSGVMFIHKSSLKLPMSPLRGSLCWGNIPGAGAPGYVIPSLRDWNVLGNHLCHPYGVHNVGGAYPALMHRAMLYRHSVTGFDRLLSVTQPSLFSVSLWVAYYWTDGYMPSRYKVR